MHAEAYSWVARFGTSDPIRVADFGGRDINGTALDHFPNADRTVVDIAPGKGVDVVADAASWVPDRAYDVVTCCEVCEHTYSWPDIMATAFKALTPGGCLIVTCAGPGRDPHSAVDGGRTLKYISGSREWYRNVTTDELGQVLESCGFVDIVLDSFGEDTRAWARRP